MVALQGQGMVVAPGEDKSAFSFSCQQCKIKKVKCSRTFPCTSCTKLGLDCCPQTRKRGRPPVSGKNSNPEQLRVKKLNDTMQSCIRFIQNMPNVLSETRIADFVKLNVRRRLGRYSFLSACLRALDGVPDSASWCKDWFGTDTPQHFLVRAGGDLPQGCIDHLRRKIYEDRVPWQPLLSVLGVTSLSEFLGTAEPRSKFLVPLETDRSWLPDSMRRLLLPTAFPGAAVLVEFQVNAHQSYSTNGDFTSKFYTAIEMLTPGFEPDKGARGFPWGSRKIFDLEDRCDLIARSRMEMLTTRQDIEAPMEFNDLVRLLDRQGKVSVWYMRRYFWLEPGGDKACTIYILYPVSQESKHLATHTCATQTAGSKPRMKKRAVALSKTTHVTQPPAVVAVLPAAMKSTVTISAPGHFEQESCASAEATQSKPKGSDTASAEAVGSVSSEVIDDESFEQLLNLLLDDADQDWDSLVLDDVLVPPMLMNDKGTII